MSNLDRLLGEMDLFSVSASDSESLMTYMCERIHAELARYNWVAFYLVDPKDPGMLILGPNIGSLATPHTRIPMNLGLCGAAALSGKTVVVDDLEKDLRVLRDSDIAKSEIVVPIFVKKALRAELDVNSYFLGAFSKAENRDFIEGCAAIVGKHLEKCASHRS